MKHDETASRKSGSVRDLRFFGTITRPTKPSKPAFSTEVPADLHVHIEFSFVLAHESLRNYSKVPICINIYIYYSIPKAKSYPKLDLIPKKISQAVYLYPFRYENSSSHLTPCLAWTIHKVHPLPIVSYIPSKIHLIILYNLRVYDIMGYSSNSQNVYQSWSYNYHNYIPLL